MKKLVILFSLFSFTAIAGLETVSPGDNISAISFNRVIQVFNKILDLQIPLGDNLYTARVSHLGAVYSESTDWIQGDALRTDTNRFQLSFKSGLFSVIPNCVATVWQGTDPAQLSVGLDSISNSDVSFRTGYQHGSGFVKYNYDFTVICQRSGTDYLGFKTIRQILVDAGLSFLD